MRKISILALGASTALAAAALPAPDTLNLAGQWRFQLDPLDFGKTPGSELYLTRLSDSIALPGSTDMACKGIPNTASHVDRLSRRYEYCGPAWYQREVTIPESWNGRHIELELERCHWTTTVYVDGHRADEDERLSTPNRFVLSDRLTPGTHTITLCVDNTVKYPMDKWAHGLTEYTQTNWNGVAGQMRLTSRPALHIRGLHTYPDIDRQTVMVKARLAGAQDGVLTLAITDCDGHRVAHRDVSVSMPADSLGIECELPIKPPLKLWDEFTPYLYTLSATLHGPQGADSTSTRFGMREVEQGRHHVRINHRDVHLRGVLDCAVFPITGYPSTDVDDWRRIMTTIRDYGMNHVRFHSWCPPQAAFEAADELGLYLQIELPMWIKDVGSHEGRRQFFEEEMYALLDEYGNHPSFVLYCNGNENEGDFAVLEDLIVKGMAHDPRHLYSASTARTHVKSDQFYASHVSPKGWITVYEGRPSTDWDLNAASDIDVPVIAHETGQRCMYPDFREIAKYTGVLEPRNFTTFRQRLAANGMLYQAPDFLRVTGAHTVLQYKAVNEALLGTSNSGGFQLLGLADFPGQGSAYVGILDAFWESKGLVTPEKFRQSCGPVVILARMPRRIYTPADTFSARIDLYNFGPSDIRRGSITWSIDDENGKPMRHGRIKHAGVSRAAVDSLGSLDVNLAGLPSPAKYTLHVSGGGVTNEWDIWLYPDDDIKPCTYAATWQEALDRLDRGENVFFIPEKPEGRRTHFASHFWNPIMFKWNPMIVGTLIDSPHGAFAGFPTADYADWQWTDILNHSTALDLTSLPSLRPVIQSIDTYEYNRKLGIAFEAKVGKGNLFVLCVDPDTKIQERPASRRLISSVASYVASDRFRPQISVSPEEIERILYPGKTADRGDSSAAAEQLLNK